MTAMSDVTVLLLTFFMLTSTFLAKEPFQANTPPSVSTEEMPMNNVAQVLVNPQGKVWITMTNDTTQEASNEKMRLELLENMTKEYAQQTGKTVSFTPEQKLAFTKLGSFGVPFQELPAFLDADTETQDKWIGGQLEETGRHTGIPVHYLTEAEKERISASKYQKGLTEYQMWIMAISRTSNDELKKAISKGVGFSLKADQSTRFETVHMIMDNMQTIGKNKFTLVTALKQEES